MKHDRKVQKVLVVTLKRSAFYLNILDEKQTKITMLLKRCKLDYFGDLLQYFLFFQCKKENPTFLILNLSDQCEEDLISNVEEKKTLFH